jgi:HTH-type transcriptional regulator/antitoxin HigA
MITNDRQYKIAKTQILNFQQSLAAVEFEARTGKDIDSQLFDVQKNAIKSQLDELMDALKEYEDLKAGKIVVTEVNSLKELPGALIKARIANGLTQAQLAEKVGLKMQQIQRYEAELYETASIKTLTKIAEALEVRLSAEIQIKQVEAPETLDLKNYPFKQMFQRKWFGNFSGSYNEAVIDSRNLLENFFEKAGFGKFQYGFTKMSIRSNSPVNMFALKAWYARIIAKAEAQTITGVYTKNTINEAWLKKLAELSTSPEGPVIAAKYLKSSGIKFIVEPHLEGTFLDGAALIWGSDVPIIAITTRHDRLDNFWFVLFHELAHVQLHLSHDLTVIFDDLDAKIEGIEKEADAFALNALIPDEVWRKSLVRFSPSKETILNQAKILHIHPALVAGRIRRETGQYFLYSDLVGQGEVRTCFSEDLN